MKVVVFLFSTAKQPLPYGICIDVTLCQQPPYHSLCSQGLPICPSPARHSNIQPSTAPPTKPALLTTVAKIITSPGVNTRTITTQAITKTIVPSKTTTVKSTQISEPGKQVNVLTIQNNFKISFGGKKSNITQAGN